MLNLFNYDELMSLLTSYIVLLDWSCIRADYEKKFDKLAWVFKDLRTVGENPIVAVSKDTCAKAHREAREGNKIPYIMLYDVLPHTLALKQVRNFTIGETITADPQSRFCVLAAPGAKLSDSILNAPNCVVKYI